jgi:AcrR family transcriptional regulator
LFEAQGYFSTTVEQIAEGAGVSKGLVYNYFGSKEELLAGLIESATSQMASVADTLAPNETIEDSVSRFLDRYVGYLKTEKRFLKLQLTLMLMPELKQVVIEPQKKRAALLLKMLSDWFRQAGVSQPKAKARLFLAMLDGVALHYLCIYEKYPLETMKPRLIQAVKDICRVAE